MSEIATQEAPSKRLLAQIRSDSFGLEIQDALPAGVDVSRFQQIAATAVMQNPELITVDQGSLFNALRACAADGLVPDGREAALTIYRDKNATGGKRAVYIPMIGGYRKICADHGMILMSEVVRADDVFEWSKVPFHVRHTWDASRDRGELTGVYAAAFWIADNRIVGPPEVLSMEEVEKVRAVSRTAQSEYGPWKNWYEAMCQKTAARRLFKELPFRNITETEKRILAAGDAESDLGEEPVMTVTEADLQAQIGEARPYQGEGPQDELDPEIEALPFGEEASP